MLSKLPSEERQLIANEEIDDEEDVSKAIEKLYKLSLLSNGDGSIETKVCKGISSFAKQNVGIKKMVDVGLVDQLINIVKAAPTQVHAAKAAESIAMIVSDSSEDQISGLFKWDFINTLGDLLLSQPCENGVHFYLDTTLLALIRSAEKCLKGSCDELLIEAKRIRNAVKPLSSSAKAIEALDSKMSSSTISPK